MAFLTDRTLATGVTLDDLIHIVITGDTSQGNPDGSSYKATIGQVLSNVIFPTDYWTSGSTGTDSIKAVNSSGLDATGDRAVAWGNNTLASGNDSTASGDGSIASGLTAHAEGFQTVAGGFWSHAEGRLSSSLGNISHAEGAQTLAIGDSSHSEGSATIAFGDYSHSEGYQTIASGITSHAEGGNTIALGYSSHAEGNSTTSIGNDSHAEGAVTIASGDSSHAEGYQSEAIGFASHAEGGYFNGFFYFSGGSAQGIGSHAEGAGTIAYGDNSHAEGQLTSAIGGASHAEGVGTIAQGDSSHAEGVSTQALGDYSHAEGELTIASTLRSHAEGYYSLAANQGAHAEGGYYDGFNVISGGTATGLGSHAEGGLTIANGITSHAEGYQTTASGNYSHSEGWTTLASGDYSHSEGQQTSATTTWAHAEGVTTLASGSASHAEGYQTTASSLASHAEGSGTIASGGYSHAGGYESEASGLSSFIHSKNSLVSGDRSAVIGGQNITGTTDDTVYVPYLNISLLGTGTSINNLGIDVNGFVVTGTTGGFTGGTVPGETIFSSGLSATTISATTIGSSTDCVDDLYVYNIHSCSPLNINPLDEGNVYFGSTSAVTIDLVNERVGVGTSQPTYRLDVLGSYGRLYNSLDLTGFTITTITGQTSGITYFAVESTDIGGVSFGVRGKDNTLNPEYGKSGDSFVRSSVVNNGLNIISASGATTEDYIRFYAGQAALGTPTMHIQGSGTTKGYIGINNDNPEYRLDVLGTTGRLFTNIDSDTEQQIGLSAQTTSGITYTLVSSPNAGTISMGIRGVNQTLNPGFGKAGDSFIYSSLVNNGLNIISQAGSGTDDYIRFYAGQLATTGNTPDLYIQGSGSTRGYVGINTANPLERLQIDDTFVFHSLGNKYMGYNTNFIAGTGDTRIVDGYSNTVRFSTTLGETRLEVSTSGNSGSTISWLRGLTVSPELSGSVSVGPTSPQAKLHINNTTSGNTFLAEDSTNPDSTPFVIDASGNTIIGSTTITDGIKLDVVGGIRTRVTNGIVLLAGGETSVSGTPTTGDGIRFIYDNNLFGTNQDGLVFEKTDFNNPTPDGGIMFANIGSGGTRVSAMSIRGDGKIGVGTDSPSEILDVSGKTKTINFQMTSGATPGYVLTSDASGNASWQASTGGGGVSIDPYNNVGSTGTSFNWDVSGLSTNYETTLTANTTLNLSNVRNGEYGTIIVKQDAVGSRTLTFGTINGAGGTHRVANGGGGSPVLTSNANAVDILTFTYNGTTMYWTIGNDYT